MKKKKQYRVMQVLLLAFLMVLVLSIPGVSREIPRNEIVWAAGHWERPGAWNPYWWGEAFGGFFMYEPLFQLNQATGVLERHLGDEVAWVDAHTIRLRLREGIYWTDGKPITTADVIYTFDLLGRYWRIGGFLERVESMVAVDATTLVVTILEEFPNSRVVWDTLVHGGWRIMPKHVWTEIEVEYPGWLPAFPNDWQDPAMPEHWKVASGPFLPYFWTHDREILRRNENWWGIEYFGLPGPRYLGKLHHATNFGRNIAFEAGMIDWHSGYLPRIWELRGRAIGPYVGTWTMMKPPFFKPVSAWVSLVFNHNIFPLSEPWLRRAISFAINYENISVIAASGYLVKGNPTFLYPAMARHAEFIDEEVLGKYGFYFDPARAVAILEQYAFLYRDSWYTKDAPVEHRGVLIEDQLPHIEGRNVRIGPWTNIVVHGWTDSMMQNVLISRDLDFINIRVKSLALEFPLYVARFQAMDFELMNFAMGLNGLAIPFDVFGAFTGTPGAWTNYAAYENPILEQLLDELDITAVGTLREREIKSEIQRMLARDLPMIPMWSNAYWYTYSTRYWTNWPNEENPHIFPTANWELGNPGAMQRLVWSLRPSGR